VLLVRAFLLATAIITPIGTPPPRKLYLKQTSRLPRPSEIKARYLNTTISLSSQATL
jgi:hypothetical protein